MYALHGVCVHVTQFKLCHRGIGTVMSVASVLVPVFLMLLREASVLVPILDRGTESLRQKHDKTFNVF